MNNGFVGIADNLPRLDDNQFDFRLPLTVSEKAVSSAILQLAKTEGKVHPTVGLAKDVQSSVAEFYSQVKSSHYAVTVLCELNESSESFKDFMRSEMPGKVRYLGITGSLCNEIENVYRSFRSKWVIAKGTKDEHHFEFVTMKPERAKAMQTLGTALYYWISTRFKIDSEVDLLSLKARGTHLKPGDYMSLTFYVLMLDTPDKGTAVKVDLSLNITNGTCSGTTQKVNLEESKVMDKGMDGPDSQEEEDYYIDDREEIER